MARQMALPVQWQLCVQQALSIGCNEFVEIGPKPVLASLVKSISKAMTTTFVQCVFVKYSSICDTASL